jgi:hypothetical protein
LGLAINIAAAEDCQPEKVNRDCDLKINRSYPVVMPTIQMHPHTKINVVVLNPLPFEDLTLDFQGAQALAGTDQTQSLASTLLPSLKGSSLFQTLQGANQHTYLQALDGGNPPPPNPTSVKIRAELEALRQTIDAASKPLKDFSEHSEVIYLQLQEILSPIPRPANAKDEINRPDGIGQILNPWDHYQDWRDWVLSELAGVPLTGVSCDKSPCPDFVNLLGEGAALQTSLTNKTTAGNPPEYPIYDHNASASFDAKAKAIGAEIQSLPESDDSEKARKKRLAAALSRVNEYRAQFVNLLPSYSGWLTAIIQDLQKYAANIDQANRDPENCKDMGNISDVAKDDKGVGRKILGRQVQFALNAVNDIGTPIVSVPSSAQKKTIVTITVLYADPIFEASAGVFFSALANRSFANQTLVTQNPGAPPTPGDVVITQGISRPTVVPFAAANFRIGSTWTYPDDRRGAFYFTAGVGINASSTSGEFGIGPSISWRSLMLTPMLHLGRDLRLTQGEFVGEVWCNQTAAHGNVPKCSGSPPAPSSERFWKPTFAVGLSVRVPSVFGSSH